MYCDLEIPLESLEEFKQKLQKLNKRARKLNCPDITSQYPISPLYRGDIGYCYLVRVTYPEIPKIKGWEFVARIENVPGLDYNFIFGPKSSELYYLRSRELTCDHCRIRRFRKHYYVVKNSNTNETLIVGSSCLRDFLGHDPKRELAIFNLLENIDSIKEDIGETYTACINLEDILETTFAVIRDTGMGYKKKEYCDDSDLSTPEKVGEELYLRFFKGRSERKLVQITDPDKQKAKDVYRDWIDLYNRTENIEDLEDIDYKKYLLVEMGGIVPFNRKWVNLAVGLGWGTSKKLEKESGRKRKEDLPEGYFGEIGKRGTFSLEPTRIRYNCNYYGTVTIVIGFRHQTNQKFVWFASGEKREWEEKVGTVVNVKATVKDWKGKDNGYGQYGQQTVLTRVTIKD